VFAWKKKDIFFVRGRKKKSPVNAESFPKPKPEKLITQVANPQTRQGQKTAKNVIFPDNKLLSRTRGALKKGLVKASHAKWKPPYLLPPDSYRRLNED
jgi:hypothetical protein